MRRVRSSVIALVASVLVGGLGAPVASADINVNVSMSGAGSVSGNGSINCVRAGVVNGTPTQCGVASVIGGFVLLEAAPLGDGTFTRWEGCPDARGLKCLAVDPFNGSVRAVFTDSTGPSLLSPTAVLSTTTDRTVTVTWTPNETLTGVECMVDGVAGTCTGTTSHTVTLPEGEHSFSVRGTDINGNLGPPAAAASFRILDTALVSTPAANSNVTNPAFVFSTQTGVGFDCALDGMAFGPCGAKGGDNRGGAQLSGLVDGTHTLRVRARDGSEFDRVPAVYTWTVDTVAPAVALGASGPGEGALQAINRETFVFSSSEAAAFECQLDGAGFGPCASGITLENLAATAHRFEVRAIDAAGNVGAVAARNWVVFAFPGGFPQGSTNPERIIFTLALVAAPNRRATKFTALQVKNVPAASTVRVTCAGKGCPSGLTGKGFTKANSPSTVSLAKFIKKPLRAGTRITVTVSKPNAIAAVKVLTVRASKKPLIATKCVPPGTAKSVAC
ncbi:hypothetical protein OJ998_23260 [Solirubrobacter taibaiensis]|nr:hypothetical protein [Solirubrobacter taibaiensis]